MDEEMGHQRDKNNLEFLNKFSTLDISSFMAEKRGLTQIERERVLKFLIKELTAKNLEILGEALDETDMAFLVGLPDVASSKLSPLLIRLPIPVFETLLASPEESFFFFLKERAHEEAVQYALSRFSKHMAARLDDYYLKLKEIEEAIQSLNVLELTKGGVKKIRKSLQEGARPAKQNIHFIERALMIAWLSLRSDLVDEFSFYKESWLKFLNLALGEEKNEAGQATGLFLQLNLKLASVFTNAPTSIEQLNDHDSVMEGLAKLSLWRLEDYADVGLISLKKGMRQTQAFAEIKKHLEEMGLKTVGDLKHHEIYSKPMLVEFIKNSPYAK